MANLELYNISGEEIGNVEVNDKVVFFKVNKQLLFDAVNKYLANQRLGTADTKTRSDVSGGGKKPWKQKGTGRARAGTIRSPLWKGGGIVFGPHPRSYNFSIGKKANRNAIVGALSSKIRGGKVKIVDSIPMTEPKTKEMAAHLKNITNARRVLVLTSDSDNYKNIYLAGRNINGVGISRVEQTNVYELLRYDEVILTKGALARFEEVFLK